jgi:quercetin dioxygenase-like cupin family protein
MDTRGKHSAKGPIMSTSKRWALIALALALVSSIRPASDALASSPEPIIKLLMHKELADLQGREALMTTVTYPPGGADPAHRHDAHVFVYVLEGSIVMGLKGEKELTLTPGQTFYEGPTNIHTVSRNASATKPAKFMVLMIKNPAIPAFTPLP